MCSRRFVDCCRVFNVQRKIWHDQSRVIMWWSLCGISIWSGWWLMMIHYRFTHSVHTHHYRHLITWVIDSTIWMFTRYWTTCFAFLLCYHHPDQEMDDMLFPAFRIDTNRKSFSHRHYRSAKKTLWFCNDWLLFVGQHRLAIEMSEWDIYTHLVKQSTMRVVWYLDHSVQLVVVVKFHRRSMLLRGYRIIGHLHSTIHESILHIMITVFLEFE